MLATHLTVDWAVICTPIRMKDKNSCPTNYPNLALLSCSHLLLIIISHREKALTAFTLLDKRIELTLPSLSFIWNKLKNPDHYQTAIFKKDYQMNICYNLAKVLLPLVIPEVLPTHMSRKTDVSLTYFHHTPIALFKTKKQTQKTQPGNVPCFYQTVVLTIITLNGIHKKWNLSLHWVSATG